jgi:hypothetical protein
MYLRLTMRCAWGVALGAVFVAATFVSQAVAQQQTFVAEPPQFQMRNNWSGVEYVDLNNAFAYSSSNCSDSCVPHVDLSFVVPTVNEDFNGTCTSAIQTGIPLQAMSLWVGFDGDPSSGGGELPQAGIKILYYCFPYNLLHGPEYFAWVEWYNGKPSATETKIDFRVVPGDNVFIVLRLEAPNAATAVFSDITAATQTSMRFVSPDGAPALGHTAECILEAPNEGRGINFVQADLPDYGSFTAGCSGWTNNSYDTGFDGDNAFQDIYVPQGFYYFTSYTTTPNGSWNVLDMSYGPDGLVSIANPILGNIGWLTWQFRHPRVSGGSAGTILAIPHGLGGDVGH